MSDLQCPAKVVLAAREMLPSLAGERFSGVYVAAATVADPAGRAAASGFAAQANCQLEILADATDGASFRRSLQDLSDVYRGETIAVIAPRELMREAIGRAADSAQPIVVSIDSSGWTRSLRASTIPTRHPLLFFAYFASFLRVFALKIPRETRTSATVCYARSSLSSAQYRALCWQIESRRREDAKDARSSPQAGSLFTNY